MKLARVTAGQRRSPVPAIVAFLVSLLLSFASEAATTFHADEPTNKIAVKAATKAMKGGKTVVRCRRMRIGPSGNPVAFKGSAYTWHTSVPEGIDGDAAIDRLSEGEKAYKCEDVERNTESGRVRRADTEDGEE